MQRPTTSQDSAIKKNPSNLESELEKSPRISLSEPPKFIIERLISGEIVTAIDPDLMELEKDAELQAIVQNTILPLLSLSELHAFNKLMFELEFKRVDMKVAFRNSSLAKFSLRFEIEKSLSEEGQSALTRLREMDENLGTVKMKLASNPLDETAQKAQQALTDGIFEDLLRLSYLITPNVQEIFLNLKPHLFPDARELDDGKRSYFVSLAMFNFYGVKLPTAADQRLIDRLYDGMTKRRRALHRRDQDASTLHITTSSSDFISVRKLDTDESEAVKKTDIHSGSKNSILNYCRGLRIEQTLHPVRVSAEDVVQIGKIQETMKSRWRFGAKNDSSEWSALCKLSTDYERFEHIQKYMQAEQKALATGGTKKILYKAIVEFYARQSIDFKHFFHVQSLPSAPILRKSRSCGN